jgi:hypothetical protein
MIFAHSRPELAGESHFTIKVRHMPAWGDVVCHSSAAYNEVMVTLSAHYDGKTIVLDEPFTLRLPSGTRLKLRVETVDEPPTATAAPRRFEPLKIRIDPELSNAIALDPQFNIDES